MKRPPLFACVAAILLAPAPLLAQSDRSGGSGFGGGSSGFGGSSFGTGGFGGSSFGSGGFGGSSFGSGGFGSDLGGSGFGQSGFGASNGGFVGRGAADVQAFFEGINQAFGGGGSRSRNRNAMDRPEANPTGMRRPPVRVKLVPDAELTGLSRGADFTARSVESLAPLLRRRGLEGVELSSRGGVLRLSGVVGSDWERLLAEKLAGMEPGVRRVQNDLVVSPPGGESLPLPR